MLEVRARCKKKAKKVLSKKTRELSTCKCCVDGVVEGAVAVAAHVRIPVHSGRLRQQGSAYRVVRKSKARMLMLSIMKKKQGANAGKELVGRLLRVAEGGADYERCPRVHSLRKCT